MTGRGWGRVLSLLGFGLTWFGLSACGSSERHDPKPSASDAAGFCQDFFAALCDHIELCACDPDLVASCRNYRCDEDALFEEAYDPIAAGTIIFDREAASALLAKFRAPPTSCVGIYADLGLDSYSAHGFGGVFRGTLSAGSTCTYAQSKKNPGTGECADGLLCLPDAGGTNRCVAIAEPGEACPVTAEHPDSSCLLRQPPDSDNEFESAFDALICLPNANSTTDGTCGTAAPNGSACNDNDQCESRRCASSDVCMAKLGVDGTCNSSSDCESGHCQFSTPSSICAPKLADGASCFQNAECVNGGCNPTSESNVSRCGPLPPAPTPQPLGAACTDSNECDSLFCRAGECKPRVCEVFDY